MDQMPSFDYISSADLRNSVSSDYSEMQRCAESGSWKSAQVLAGSIVECLLIDYLTSTTAASRPTKDPLKMDLAEAIDICKAEGVLTSRTADLCSVIRSYRNLIHPGRMVRLSESAPDKTSCSIAVALIDLIVEDVAKTRRATVGLTAEQILSKIVRDAGCATILPHLMAEVSDEQRGRLLLDLIPSAYFDWVDQDDFDDTKDRLSTSYRSILDSATEPIKKSVAARYVKILKEEDGDRVSQFRKAFFRAPDLAYLDPAPQAMVREHLLAAPASIHNTETLRILDGIGQFLTESDAVRWFDPFMRTLASTNARDSLKNRTRELFSDTICFTARAFDQRLAVRVNDWVLHYEKQNASPALATLARELLEEVKAISTPGSA